MCNQKVFFNHSSDSSSYHFFPSFANKRNREEIIVHIQNIYHSQSIPRYLNTKVPSNQAIINQKLRILLIQEK